MMGNVAFEVYFTKFTSIILSFMAKSSPMLTLGLNLNFESFNITTAFHYGFEDAFKFFVSASLKLGDLGREKKKILIRSMYSKAMELVSQNDYEAARVILIELLAKQPRHELAIASLHDVEASLKLMREYNKIIGNENVLE
jgi:hypothetical protein